MKTANVTRRGRARLRDVRRFFRARVGYYDAFLSHGRQVDGKLAAKVQRGLCQLARPWYKRQALRVFRDITDLGASENLAVDIERALRRSRALIVICHPKAAASRWVCEEIEFWLKLRQKEGAESRPIYLVHSGGQLKWSRGAGRWSNCTNALPAPLYAVFASEPSWVDLMDVRSGSCELHDGEFLAKLSAIAAPLHGSDQTPELLVGADRLEHRRRLRAVTSVSIAIAALAAIAMLQYREAEQRAIQLEVDGDLSRAELLSNTVRDRFASALAIEAYALAKDRLGRGDELLPQLATVAQRARDVDRIEMEDQVSDVVPRSDGTFLVMFRTQEPKIFDSSFRASGSIDIPAQSYRHGHGVVEAVADSEEIVYFDYEGRLVRDQPVTL